MYLKVGSRLLFLIGLDVMWTRVWINGATSLVDEVYSQSVPLKKKKNNWMKKHVAESQAVKR